MAILDEHLQYRGAENASLQGQLAEAETGRERLKREFEASVEKLSFRVEQLSKESSQKSEQAAAMGRELAWAVQCRADIGEKLDLALGRLQALEEKREEDLQESGLELEDLRMQVSQLSLENAELRGELAGTGLSLEKLGDELEFERNVKRHL
jgi:hypothetical protein